MAAHASGNPSPASDLGGDLGGDRGGIERRIARLLPPLMVGAIAILGIAWWMAAQPPPGPGWNDPNGPRYPYPQQNFPPPPPQQPAQPPSSGCSACSGDCLSGIDCGDCLECGDCISGLDCSGCTVAPSSSAAGAMPASPPSRRACSTNPWKRLAGSSGLLLPLFVLIGWRRRIRR